MADVLNKNTLEYKRSVHTPNYEGNPDWLINPDLSAVKQYPRSEWKVEGEQVVRKSKEERDSEHLILKRNIIMNLLEEIVLLELKIEKLTELGETQIANKLNQRKTNLEDKLAELRA